MSYLYQERANEGFYLKYILSIRSEAVNFAMLRKDNLGTALVPDSDADSAKKSNARGVARGKIINLWLIRG